MPQVSCSIAVCLLSLTALSTAGIVYVDHAATGGNSGLDWANAYTSIVPALSAASTNDQIWVAQGSYRPGAAAGDTFALGGRHVYGGFASGDTWGDRAPAAKPTVLSGDLGNGSSAHHVVTGIGTLDGVTVTGGRNKDLHGAGLYASGEAGWLVLRDCVFSDNVASNSSWGSAVFLDGAGLKLTVAGCTFSSNGTPSAYPNQGGAVYVRDLGHPLTFSNCVFRGNAARQQGGSVSVEGDIGDILLTGCSFEGNRLVAATTGGAAVYGALSSNVNWTVVDCIFSNNTSTGPGGAIRVHADADNMVISNCVFTGNVSANGSMGYPAGTVLTRALQGLRISDTEFVANTSTATGAGFVHDDNSLVQNVVVNGCRFEDNVGANGSCFTSYGSSGDYGPFVFSGCTFRGNSNHWGSGGAIYTYRGRVALNNCTFDGNVAPSRAAASIGAIGTTQSIDIVGCSFSNNFAGGTGGAVYVGEAGSTADLLMSNCTFRANVTAGNGSALVLNSCDAAEIAECTIASNRTAGGSLYIAGSGVTTCNVRDCDFIGNRLQHSTAAYGAAIHYYASGLTSRALTIEGCAFHGNTSTHQAGGLYVRCSGVDFTVEDCDFVQNQASVAPAGVYVHDANTASFINSSFKAHTNQAVYVNGPTQALVRGCTFEHNARVDGYDGGALGFYQSADPDMFRIENTSFSTNTATRRRGGGLYGYGGTLVIADSVFRGNVAAYGAGAAEVGGMYSIIVDDCDFVANRHTAYSGYVGGAIYATAETLTFKSSRFIGNVGRNNNYYSGGGALRLNSGTGGCRIVNCTFATNVLVAGTGGGNAVRIGDGSLTVVNSIFWSNVVSGSASDYDIAFDDAGGGETCEIRYSCFDTNRLYVRGGNTRVIGPHVNNRDPELVDPEGGDFHLRSRHGHWTPSGWVLDPDSSRNLDAGDPAYPYDREPAENGGRVNIGGYGNTDQASRSGIPAGGITPAGTAVLID